MFCRIAAEKRNYHLKLAPTVKMYSDAALVGITGSNCSQIYPCVETEKIKYRQNPLFVYI